MIGLNHPYKSSISNDTILCTYPISPSYGTAHRLVIYILFAFSIFSNSKVKGSLALFAVFAATGVASIHAVLLAITSRNAPVFDLDAVGIYAIISSIYLLMPMAICWSPLLRKDRPQAFAKMWGGLLLLGLSFSLIALLYNYPDQQAVKSASGVVLTLRSQLIQGDFNGTYSCFDHSSAFREAHETVAVLADNVMLGRGHVFTLSMIILLAPIAATMTTFLPAGKQMDICNCCKHGITSIHSGKPTCPICKHSTSQHQANDTIISDFSQEPKMISKLHRDGISNGTVVVAMFVSPISFLINVGLVEYYILSKPGLPITESSKSVGQWGQPVIIILTLLSVWYLYGFELEGQELKEEVDGNSEGPNSRARTDPQVETPTRQNDSDAIKLQLHPHAHEQDEEGCMDTDEESVSSKNR